VLTPAERDRAARGTLPVHRRRVLVRAGLRQLLGQLLDLPPAAVPLGSDRGRPVVLGRRWGRRPQASCSTSGDVALIGVSTGVRLSVDVQQVHGEDVEVAVAEGWLTEDERRGVDRLPPPERARAVARAWVQKEAVLKAEGCGLIRSPRTVLTPGADHGLVEGWALSPVHPAGGAVACLAVRAPTCRRWVPQLRGWAGRPVNCS